MREVAADATSGLVTPDEYSSYLDMLLSAAESLGENQVGRSLSKAGLLTVLVLMLTVSYASCMVTFCPSLESPTVTV